MTPLLISPEELLAQQFRVRLVDARAGAETYAKGHLLNAVPLELNADLSSITLPGSDPARGGRHPLPSCATLGARLDSFGIKPDADVVLYDDQAGAVAAGYAYWQLTALGASHVRVLDGGLSAALAAGFTLTTDVPHFVPTRSAWRTTWGRPTVTLEEVAARAGTPEWKVLDVRSPERFRGEVEPLDPVAGHIPGAVNLFYMQNLGANGRYKTREELRAMYTELLAGLPPEKLIVHCGSGVTACHTLVALEHAGLAGSSLYVGSWSEWCRSGRPQAKGA